MFLPAVDCFLCPRICTSQSEGRTQCKCFPGLTDGIELSRVVLIIRSFTSPTTDLVPRLAASL